MPEEAQNTLAQALREEAARAEVQAIADSIKGKALTFEEAMALGARIDKIFDDYGVIPEGRKPENENT